MRNIIDREQRTRRHEYPQNAGESVEYQVDFSRIATNRGVTITGATWEAVDGSVTITNETLTVSKAKASLAMANAGKGLVKVSAIQSDGNTRVSYIAIKAVDPRGSTGDYC